MGRTVSSINAALSPRSGGTLRQTELAELTLAAINTNSRQRALVKQAREGEGIELYRPRVMQRSPLNPSAKMHINEVWGQIWEDASEGGSMAFPPESLLLMDQAKIQCSPTAGVPKQSPRTGEILQRKARIISNCSWRGRVALLSVTEIIIMDYLGTFDMPRHIDITRINLFLRYWLGMEIHILGCKRDVEGAFRRKYVAPSSFGTLSTEVNGHTILEVTFICESVLEVTFIASRMIGEDAEHFKHTLVSGKPKTPGQEFRDKVTNQREAARWDARYAVEERECVVPEELHEQMINRAEMKVSNNPKRKDAKRERYVIDFSTQAWIEKKKAVDLAALAGSTSAQYVMYWNFVVEFAEDHHLDYILTGKNTRKDEDFPLKYALYEFEIHGNSYDTVQ